MLNFLMHADSYTDLLERLVAAHSALSPLALLFLEEAGVPIFIPGDLVLAYTGYRISVGHPAALGLALLVALVAVLAGATILFFLARKWGDFVIYKLGAFIFLDQKRIAAAEKLFRRYGAWAIIFGRHIPGMRIPITIFAATSGVRYWTFILSTLVSTSLWIILYLDLGRYYGQDIQHAVRRYTHLSLFLFALFILAIIGLHLLGRYQRRRSHN